MDVQWAGSREPTSRSRSISFWRRDAHSLHVHDVHVIEDRHVHGVPRLVAKPPKVSGGYVPELIEFIAVIPRSRTAGRGCTSTTPGSRRSTEPGEHGDVSVRSAAREAELVRDLADADQSAIGRELRQDREAALERLRRPSSLLVAAGMQVVLHRRTAY